MPSITIFWIEVTDGEAEILEQVARARGAALVELKAHSLAPLALAALAQGAVVFVARTQQEATRALGMGVDETIRAGEITKEALDATLERATLRAEVRISADWRHQASSRDHALGALLSAFGRRLEQPLLAASLAYEALETALGIILDIDDKFVRWSVLGTPIEEARDLAVRRLALAPSATLKELAARIRAGLEKAGVVSAAFARLSDNRACSPAPIGQVVRDVIDVMRPELAGCADLAVHIENDCRVTTAPATVAFVLGALLEQAADAIRRSPCDGGRIEVLLREEDGIVVLDIWDNGARRVTGLGPSMLVEPYFGDSRRPLMVVDEMREHLRAGGGDLLVESGAHGTTARVLLPTSVDQVVHEQPADATELTKKTTH